MTDKEAESQVYGCDHTEIAIAAANKWGFPEPLVKGLYYSEPPDSSDQYAVNRACVAVASAIAWLAVSGTSETEESDEPKLPEWATQILGITSDREPEIIAGGKGAIAESATLQI
jgi:hypothetical protein